MAGPVIPVHVQDTTVNLTATTTTMSPALTGVAAGNTLVLAVSSRTITTGYIASTVTDSATATWLRGPVEQSSAGTVEWWYGVNAAAATHTLTVTTTSGTNGCWLAEFSGCATVAPIVDATAVNTATATSVTVSLTPANDYELLLFATVSANVQSASPSAPFVAAVGPTSAGSQVAGVAYVAGNALTAAYAPVWTQTSGVFAAVGLALKGASPPGDLIWNDTAAQANPAIFEPQARPDFLDSVIGGMASLGVGVLSGCAVSPNTNADFNFQVSAGTALFNWGQVTVAAATARAVTASDGTNPRRDLVYATPAGTVNYLAGAANATPCPPALPINCIALAIIEVPANATVLAEGTNTAQAYVTDKRALLAFPDSQGYYFRPSASLFDTVDRRLPNSTFNPTSGTLYLIGLYLPAGLTIGHLAFVSAGVQTTPTHWWFALFSSNLNLLAVTADQTTSVWGGTTLTSLAVATTAQGAATTFTTTYTGLYYIGQMQAASTTATLFTYNGGGTVVGALSPALSRTSNTAQTVPPAFPFTASAGSVNANSGVYGYVAS